MDKIITAAREINGETTVPGDKSISHRALMLGAICNGEVMVSGLSSAEDCQSTLLCLQSLGIEFDFNASDSLVIKGKGLSGLAESKNILDARNSGTTARLMTGLLAGRSIYSVITGDESLRNRPMKRVIDPLKQMGASISGRSNNTMLPIAITGTNLHAIEYVLPMPSAQVKSAILLAGLHAAGKTTVIEKLPSRDHTERLLTYLGAKIESDSGVTSIEISELSAKEIYIPGDISSAVYFIAAAVISKNSRLRINNVGLNPTRMGAIDIMQEMGANIEVIEKGIRCGEPYGDIKAASSELKGIRIAPKFIPSLIDEIPILALAATQASGTTTIEGAGELRFKESDRLKTTADLLNTLGANLHETGDGLVINGKTPLTGSKINSYMDHRLAMTGAIAGIIAKNETTIENCECIAISFPDFFEKLKTLSGNHQ